MCDGFSILFWAVHHGKNRSVTIPYNPFLSVSVGMISELQTIIIIYMGLSRFCFYRDV